MHRSHEELCLGCGAIYIDGKRRGDIALPLLADLENPAVLLFNLLTMLSERRRGAVQMLDDVFIRPHSDKEINDIRDLIEFVAKLKDELVEIDSGFEASVRDAALNGAELCADIEEVQRVSQSRQVNAVGVLAYYYVDRLISSHRF